MTIREQLAALITDAAIVDAQGGRFPPRLPDLPPGYTPPGDRSVRYEMRIEAARLMVFLINNAEAIRDALP